MDDPRIPMVYRTGCIVELLILLAVVALVAGALIARGS